MVKIATHKNRVALPTVGAATRQPQTSMDGIAPMHMDLSLYVHSVRN